MTEALISHAFVLPDENFQEWLNAVRPYTQKFERVAIIRSPRGNDLNRYRNVTAVRAPLTWANDDPVSHIRRIYPMVVRVDVINANTPQALATALQTRIANNDRYGTRAGTTHIHDRFILEYPLAFNILQIVDTHDDIASLTADMGIKLLSSKGMSVLASAGGRVTRIVTANDALNIGAYVQISTPHGSKTYVTTYGNLERITAKLNATVATGDPIGTASGEALTLILQDLGAGKSGYALPHIIDPSASLYITNLRVRPKAKGLRVRSVPSLSGEVLGFINPWDALESLEMHGRTLAKVGKENAWLRIKLPDGRSGFTAGWLLDAIVRQPFRYSGVNITGVNLDQLHERGKPAPSRLGNIGWVRFGYNLVNRTDNNDLQGHYNTLIRNAYDRYAPLVEQYVKAGYKVVFTTSHQTYGEGLLRYHPWQSMDDAKWRRLTDEFADVMYRIARQWAGKGLVEAWQVWNEPDGELHAEASVTMSANNYRNMLVKLVPQIRAGDPDAVVLTAGMTGTQSGSTYIRSALSGLTPEAMPDGIAIHPYGRTPRPQPDRYGHFGHIDDILRDYGSILPKAPLWITEWGVLNAGFAPANEIGDYALAMINHLRQSYRDKVVCAIWYAWAETMHNGYGIVDAFENSRAGLTDRFLKA